MEEQKNVKQKAYHKWICTKSPEDRTEYKKELTTFKKLLNKERNGTWERKCAEINSFLGGSRSNEAWKFINNLRSDKSPKVNIPFISLNKFQEHYKNELKVSPLCEMMSPTAYRTRGTYMTVSLDMVEKALIAMKNGKSSGPEGIPAELLKCGPKILKEILACIFTTYINGEPIPDSWKTSWITPIHKKGRKDICTNYRCTAVSIHS